MGYYDPPDMHEGSYNITCQGYLPENTRAVPLDLISHLRTMVEDNEDGTKKTLDAERIDRVLLEMLDMPKAVDVECGFEGGVDATFGGGKLSYTAYWTCPRCGTEGEEDREVGDDHPDL